MENDLSNETEQPTLENLEQSFTEKIKIFSKHLTFLATSIVGFTALAYIIGWIYARSYYNTFNASWLVPELNSIEIISYSWKSVVGLMIGFYNGLIILMENPKRIKYLRQIFDWGTLSIVLIYLVFLILSFWKINIDNTINALLQIPFLITTLAVIFILIFPQQVNVGRNSFLILIYCAFLLWGSFHYIDYRGKSDARIDLDIEHSTLSKVKLKFDGRQSLKIFKLKGNIFYVVDLDSSNNKSMKMQAVNSEDIDYISKPK
jgi:hypothetical protein